MVLAKPLRFLAIRYVLYKSVKFLRLSYVLFTLH